MENKKQVRLTVTTADNGFILEVWDESPKEIGTSASPAIDHVKLVFTSRPKLLKAISKFLDYDSSTSELEEEE